jgi:hypothetical protein
MFFLTREDPDFLPSTLFSSTMPLSPSPFYGSSNVSVQFHFFQHDITFIRKHHLELTLKGLAFKV